MELKISLPCDETQFKQLTDVEKFAIISRSVNTKLRLIAKVSNKQQIGYDNSSQTNLDFNKVIAGITKII